MATEPRMDGETLLSYMSNFWRDKFKNRALLVHILNMYVESTRQRATDIAHTSLSKSIEYHPGRRAVLWDVIIAEGMGEDGAGRTYALSEGTLHIPTLQNRYEDPTEVLTSGQDYSITVTPTGSTITFTQPRTDATRRYFAPVAYYADPTVKDNFQIPLFDDVTDLGIEDTLTLLNILRAVHHLSYQGPTFYNLQAMANAVSGHPFADFAGHVTGIGTDRVHINFGDICEGVTGATGDLFIAGERVATFSGSYTDATGLWVYDRDIDNTLSEGDYISLTNKGKEVDAKIEDVSVHPYQTIKAEEDDGTGRIAQDVLTDRDSDVEFGSVLLGDLLEVTSSPRTFHRIVRAQADRVFLETPIATVREDITYIIHRMSHIRASRLLLAHATDLSWYVTHPNKSWKQDMWKDHYITDSNGKRFVVRQNEASALRLFNVPQNRAGWISDGQASLSSPFEGDTKGGTYLINADVSTVVEEGDYVRRFEPLTDGVQIRDWRTDHRWHRHRLPIYVLSADTTEGDTIISLITTDDISNGDIFRIEDDDTTGYTIRVTEVIDQTRVRVNRAVGGEYTRSAFARLVPVRKAPEGLSGYYPITELRHTGYHAPGATIFRDDGASFDEDDLSAGDDVRIIVSGKPEIYSILQVTDAHALSLTDSTPLPIATTTSLSQTAEGVETIEVADVSQLAQGQIIQIGTGTNAQERTIEAINGNVVTCNLAVSADRGTVVTAGRQGLSYRIVRTYEATDYSRFDLNISIETLTQTALSAVYDLVDRQKPGWVAPKQIPIVTEKVEEDQLSVTELSATHNIGAARFLTEPSPPAKSWARFGIAEEILLTSDSDGSPTISVASTTGIEPGDEIVIDDENSPPIVRTVQSVDHTAGTITLNGPV